MNSPSKSLLARDRPRNEGQSSSDEHDSSLALYARGREIGYVVICDGDMYHFGVKTIRVKRREKGFVKQVGKTVFSLLEWIEPEGLVVIERRKAREGQGQLSLALAHVVEAFVLSIYPLMEISLDEMKQALCGSKRVTNERLVERVVAMYPTFWSRHFGAGKEKARYWQKALIALALALTAEERLREKNL